MRLQCDPRLATRLGSEKVEAGWRPVWGEEWERLVGNSSVEREGGGWLATRLGSEKGEAGWSDDDIKSLPAQNIRRLPVLLSSLA